MRIKEKNGVVIRCSDCQMLIKGNSEANAKANLEIHKTSTHHKTQIKLIASAALTAQNPKVVNSKPIKKKGDK